MLFKYSIANLLVSIAAALPGTVVSALQLTCSLFAQEKSPAEAYFSGYIRQVLVPEVNPHRQPLPVALKNYFHATSRVSWCNGWIDLDEHIWNFTQLMKASVAETSCNQLLLINWFYYEYAHQNLFASCHNVYNIIDVMNGLLAIAALLLQSALIGGSSIRALTSVVESSYCKIAFTGYYCASTSQLRQYWCGSEAGEPKSNWMTTCDSLANTPLLVKQSGGVIGQWLQSSILASTYSGLWQTITFPFMYICKWHCFPTSVEIGNYVLYSQI